MAEYTRRDFEREFNRLNFDLKEIVMYYALRLAELTPTIVKEQYKFLTNGEMSEAEKRRLLLVVYDITGNPGTFLSCLFTSPKGIPPETEKTIARMINRDSYRLIRKARKHDIDTQYELEFVQGRRRHILNTEAYVTGLEDLKTYLSLLLSEPGTMH